MESAFSEYKKTQCSQEVEDNAAGSILNMYKS